MASSWNKSRKILPSLNSWYKVLIAHHIKLAGQKDDIIYYLAPAKYEVKSKTWHIYTEDKETLIADIPAKVNNPNLYNRCEIFWWADVNCTRGIPAQNNLELTRYAKKHPLISLLQDKAKVNKVKEIEEPKTRTATVEDNIILNEIKNINEIKQRKLCDYNWKKTRDTLPVKDDVYFVKLTKRYRNYYLDDIEDKVMRKAYYFADRDVWEVRLDDKEFVLEYATSKDTGFYGNFVDEWSEINKIGNKY